MQLIKTPAPFLSSGRSVRSSMLDMLLCFAALLVWAWFLYGPRSLLVAAVSVFSCVTAEYLASRLAHLPHSLSDFSAIVSGLVIALLCPVTVPLWIVCVMGGVAMLLAKTVFGGLGHNPFNPSAAALAFATVAWPGYMLKFPLPFQKISLFNPLANTSLKIGQSILSTIKLGGKPSYRISEILFGTVPEAMGVSALLVILACFIYLVVRKTIEWRITFSYLGTVAVLSALFPRVGDPLYGAFYELAAGYLVFAAVFMMNDPSTAPKSNMARFLYGVIGGILTVYFRYSGTYAEGICFALLIVNALGPTLDRLTLIIERRRVLHEKSEKPKQHRIYFRKA